MLVPVPEELRDRICVGEVRELPESRTRRPTSPGAERWLGVPIRVLDRGFVMLVDYCGNDESIVQAARVSYGRGTRKLHEDKTLIRYLRRHLHTSPFEMAELKFYMKLPIFVARQIVRHRTASINEVSGRYSVLEDEFYLPPPEEIAAQSTSNRQGRQSGIPPEARAEAARLITTACAAAYSTYERLLELGVARELARLVLPVNIYTRWYWKIDLHNLLHFLRLRLDPHAQEETRAYAEAIATITREAFPLAWEAFEDYTLGSVPLSSLEIKVLRRSGIQLGCGDVEKLCDEAGLQNRREREEFLQKLGTVGLIRMEVAGDEDQRRHSARDA